MKFSIDPEIFIKWPEVRLGVIIALGVDNTRGGEESMRLLRREEEKTKTLTELPVEYIQPWRQAYEDFGASPKKYLSSIESLLTRLVAGKSLPDINPLVNFYNYTSLKYKLPFGGEDLDKVLGDIELTFAEGIEKGVYLGGEKEEVCLKGEVIYKDAAGFICRRWNWREADRTKLTKETKNLVMVAEILTEDREKELSLAVGEFAKLAEEVLGGRTKLFVLDRESPVAEVDFLTGTKTAGSLGTKEKHRPIKQMGAKKEEGKGVSGEMADAIRQVLATAASVDIGQVSLEHPELEEHGDYSTNIALVLKGGRKLAEKIAGKIKSDDFEVSVAGSGFINFRLLPETLMAEMGKVLSARYTALDGKKIMVEFAHPNTHKELHIGHMRTLITGEAVAKILERCGAEVFRANYQGDIGPHVAKSIWGTLRIVKEQKKVLEDWEKENLAARAHLLGEGYVRGNEEYEQNKAEIDALNVALYRNDPKWAPVYERTRRWSLDYYEEFYRRFGTRFDKLYFESKVAEQGKRNVLDNLGKVFEESLGAIIFDGEKYGLHKRVFVTAAGVPTYEGKDMALAFEQFHDFVYDKIIHVVANEQAEYFKVIIKAMEMIDNNMIGRQYHLSMGMVNLVGGKISSRKGEVVAVDRLISDIREMARPLMKDYNEKVIEAVALGAIKYSILKTHPTMNIVFDLRQSVALDGNSGPYLQYTYARTQSVLRKSAPISTHQHPSVKSDHADMLNSEELAVLRWIYRFPEVVQEAGSRYAPNLVCNFLYELAQRFNTFYNKHSILGAEVQSGKGAKQFRLAMTRSVGEVLKFGLNLLGIEALERM